MAKRFKNGLVLGKFYPPHLGHLFLIDSALKQCETVHVMVCTLERETIPGTIRYNWIKNHYKNKKGVKVIHCNKELPQYPSDCETEFEFYNQYWVPTVYSYVDQLDAVFTSEDYGDEFASWLELEHVLVDKQRNTFPVSGTKIRNKPLSNWDFIPNAEKSYFTKRIAILGPESVGKSTLNRKLADYFKSEYIEEYGRTYTEKTGTKNLKTSDFIHIAKKQYKMNFAPMKVASKFLFCDTEAITTKVFADMYINKRNIPQIEDIIAKQKFDLWLLLDIDVPWVDDGTRDFQGERQKHLKLLKNELDSRGINYVTISGSSYKTRFKKAISEVNKLLK
jgi:HTH-type transcriptional repressor of NAD biosynthesis genes